MKKGFALAFAITMAFGCGGGDDDDTTGDGGTTADAAVATCDEATRTMCFSQISCFTNIFTDCVPSGTCTLGMQTVSGGKLVAPMCFGNGVKSVTEADLANALMTTGTSYKPGGAVCYKWDATTMTNGDGVIVYKNAAGTMLATQKYYGNGSPMKIQCAGMAEVTLDSKCSGCGGTGGTGGTSGCTQGTCTVP